MDTSDILHLPVAKGGSLSSGERQLLALARAVLRRTNIVIMDEATSQIDSNLDDKVRMLVLEKGIVSRKSLDPTHNPRGVGGHNDLDHCTSLEYSDGLRQGASSWCWRDLRV